MMIIEVDEILPEHVLGWEFNLRVFYVDISARRPWSPPNQHYIKVHYLCTISGCGGSLQARGALDYKRQGDHVLSGGINGK